MKTVDPTQRDQATPPTSRDLTRAWISVVLIPVFFVLAIAFGEGTSSLLGYNNGGSYPTWVGLVSDAVATVVCLAPCVAAVLFGRKARELSVRAAIVPIVIGYVVGAGWLLMTIVSEIGNLL